MGKFPLNSPVNKFRTSVSHAQRSGVFVIFNSRMNRSVCYLISDNGGWMLCQLFTCVLSAPLSARRGRWLVGPEAPKLPNGIFAEMRTTFHLMWTYKRNSHVNKWREEDYLWRLGNWILSTTVAMCVCLYSGYMIVTWDWLEDFGSRVMINKCASRKYD